MLLIAMLEQLSNKLFETADMLMLMDAVCKHERDKLGYTT